MATTKDKIGMSKAKLPKTAEAAAKAGHKKIRVNFRKLSDSDKKKWVVRKAATGARVDLAGTYRDGPSPTGGIIRCYYDPQTGNYDICHKLS
jgi:hypothetical protein